MTSVPTPAPPGSDLAAAAREFLAIQREHEQRTRRTRHHIVAAARAAGMTWADIGAHLGIPAVTARITHQRHTTGSVGS